MEQKTNKGFWEILKAFITGEVFKEIDTKKAVYLLVFSSVYAFTIIANTYHGQKQVYKIELLKTELKELKFKDTVTKTELSEIINQPVLEKRLKSRKLYISKEHAQKIRIKK